MGSSFTKIKYVANEYRDYPPGCIPCPEGSTPGNPGTFEDIHKKFENLDPKVFEGARLMINKHLSKHFNVTHLFNINTVNKPLFNTIREVHEQEREGYIFGASYVGTKKIGIREKYPILFGTMTPDGHLKANFIHSLGCRCRIKLFTHVQKNKYKNSKATIEYRSDDFTGSVTVINPWILNQQGVLVLHFLQAITSRITLGAEVAYSKIPSLSKRPNGHIAGAFRYSTGFQTVTATISQVGARICYHHRQSQNLQMGVEIKTNLIKRESKSRILYQVNIPRADLVFKGFVDTDWRVGGILEKQLYPLPEASLLLSGYLDHYKQSIQVGIGLNIES